MTKRYVFTNVVLLLTLSAGWAGAHDRKDDEGPEFEAKLTGSQEVPPVETDARGKFEIEFNKAFEKAEFELGLKNINRVQQAHLHCGESGENGPVVVTLLGLVPEGIDVPKGEVEGFVLTDANILPAGTGGGANDCPAVIGRSIANLRDLAEAARDGLIYANVHTVENPAGEIRGQLEEDKDDNNIK